MGSGPFKLAHLDQTLHYWDVDRFAEYWRGWPLDWPAFGSSKPAGYIEHYVVTWNYDWSARSAMFLDGEVDLCAVPRLYVNQVHGQPGVRRIYPLPSLSVDEFFFQFNINSTSPYGPILPPGTFNESGVPSDFFGNATWGIHVRKAFASIIDYDSYISAWFHGDAIHPATAIFPALPYYDPTVKGYSYNLSLSEKELKQVPGLWDTGFTIRFLYFSYSGSLPRDQPYTQIAQSINSLNPKFHCSVLDVGDWYLLLLASVNKQLPAFVGSWLADYPDPHNFAYRYYHSRGNYASRQGYNSSAMDALIDLGISQVSYQEREATYGSIQQLVIDDCPSAALATVFGNHFERTWVCGWYYNPSYPDNYAANLWKWYYTPHAQQDTVTNATANLLPYDLNYDGKTNMYDIGPAALCFGAVYGPPISSKWVYRCDLNNDRKIDMKDIAGCAKNFGKTSSAWPPPP
jgi:peptide/nickel transport system substrate-binding protein